MFASLRYQRKNHYRSFRFASLRFDTIAITVPHFSISLGAFDFRGLCFSWRCLHHRGWAASERVCTTEACAAPEGVYTTGAWAASERVCTTEACAAPEGVYATGAELHLNLSALQTHAYTYCRKCSLRFENNLLNVGHVRFASKIIFLFSNLFALLRK